ncbi:hypothetical protein R5R35_014243 [Gryllus longicercus]|uniref:Integrin alpha-2 domain-containing protein n=1 Tax=Gryllus longicercus TaxID=2509291 RepID=A0AAN9ZDV0_9ORTH
MKCSVDLVLTAVLSLLECMCVFSFNLDFRIPIVKRQQADTYFGFSVAEHQTLAPSGNVQSWLLVGAPRGVNLQPNTTRSGALFKCPLTTRLNDCEQVVTDGKRASKNLQPPLPDEHKEDQWMGVTVRSQGRGGNVLVCAHRYIYKGRDRQAMWGFGLCYLLKQDFEFGQAWEPCRGRPIQLAHEQFGFCQAGTSGALLADDEAVVGSPGPHTWRGTMFLQNISTADFLTRDKTVYYGPVLDPVKKYAQDVSPVDKYSYLGMSVAGGRFFGTNETLYAAGAPRANNGTGQVAFFAKRRRGDSVLAVRLLLAGEQFASSFGYELATADVDGDGVDDLLVGAPFFFSRHQGGAVYVYRRINETCGVAGDACNVPQKLTGLPESRFGFAIANAGDLNKDGFADVAVGAPYEGSGAVYVFLGSSEGLLPEPSQVVRVSDLPSSVGRLSAFGHSLSGGVDMDLNSYPDLLAGAYEGDAVVLLRARPIVGISTRFHPDPIANIDHQRPGCLADRRSPHACFAFHTCAKLDPLAGERRGASAVGGQVRLNYTLEAETFQPGRKFSRVWFKGVAPSHVVRRDILVDARSDRETCQEEIVYVKEGITDIQSPIRFRVAYSLVQREPVQPRPGEPLPPIDDYPILNQQEAAKTFEATFQKDCGDNDICESRLFLEARLLLPNARRVNTSELVLGRHDNVTLNVTAYNLRESAYSARLFISHPRSLNYTHYKSENPQLSCQPVNATLVQCALGNPFQRNARNNFLVVFNPRDIRDDEARFAITAFANSTSTELTPQPPLVLHMEVVRRAEMGLTALSLPDRLLYGGVPVGESAVRSQEQVGTRVVHVFKLYNAGPWVARNVELRIDWPHQVYSPKQLGKWLLYLAEPLRLDVEGGGECQPNEGVINPLGLLPEAEVNASAAGSAAAGQTPRHAPRTKRDVEMVLSPETHYDEVTGRQHNIVRMSCSSGTAKCIVFRCRLYELGARKEATVTVTSRLWNSTLVDDYPRVDAVHITSHARLHLPQGSLLQQNGSDDVAEAMTMALPDRLDVHEPESVPYWIIAVAVGVGLLLLVALILILWKLGFFKRRRPDPTLSGNLEKHRDENGS